MGSLLSQKAIFLTVLTLYAFGAPFSQSLMSIGATLLMIFFVLHLVKSWSVIYGSPWTRVKLWLASGLLYVFVLAIGLFFREPLGRALYHIREVPLFLIPLLPLLPSFRKENAWSLNDLRIPVLAGFLSLIYSVSILLYQTLILGVEGSGVLRSSIFTAYNLLPIFLYGVVVTQHTPVRRGFWRWAPSLIAGLSFLGIVLTGSRGATFSCLVVAIVVFWKKLPRLRRSRNWMMGALATMVLLTAVVSYQYQHNRAFRNRYQYILSPLSIPSVQWRLQIWDYNLYLFQKHPVFGVGYGKNGMVKKRMKDAEFPGRKYRQKLSGFHAHSIYIQALAESGIVGFLLLMGWLFLPATVERRLAPFTAGIAISGFNEAIFFNSRVANSLFCFLLIVLMHLACVRERARGE
jgi:O-antigen ligase